MKNTASAAFKLEIGDPGGTRLLLKQKSSAGRRLKKSRVNSGFFSSPTAVEPNVVSRHTQISPKNKSLRDFFFGEGRPDVVARLCMVVDWCINHPEYTAKIKVIPKKDYPVLMPCEF